MEHRRRAVQVPARRTRRRRGPVPSALGQDLRPHRHGVDAGAEGLAWAEQARIKTGADYLRAWVACAFRCPFEPTPYLFLFGGENCGKSIFYETLELLVTKGVVKADHALTATRTSTANWPGRSSARWKRRTFPSAPAPTPRSRSGSRAGPSPSARCGTTATSSPTRPTGSRPPTSSRTAPCSPATPVSP